MRNSQTLKVFAAVLAACAVTAARPDAEIDPALTEVWQPEPAIVTPGDDGAAPSDALVLLGDDTSAWTAWTDDAGNSDAPVEWAMSDGVMTVTPGAGSIQSKRSFGSVQLHVEWRSPVMDTEGQLRGNSGVFLQKRYEVQILDSYNNRTYSNGQASSIYKQHIPLVNASRPPGEWQSYDIIYSAPEFSSAGTLTKPAYVTVLHNGVLVQDHVEIRGTTEYRGAPSYAAHGTAPIGLQDHGDRVSFRNIWVREL